MKQQEFLVKLGNRIREARLNADLTQTKLAYRMRVSRTQICNIEAGRSNTSVWMLAKIAASCGVELSDLLARREKSAIAQSVIK